jgi:hypothetical protein
MSVPQLPFLPLSILEARAEAVLRRALEAGVWNGRWPVPVDAIAEILLGLTIELGDLTHEFGTLDSVGEGELLGAIDFGERTIWIDQSLDPDKYSERLSRYLFTLAHEIAHWILHAALYGARSSKVRLAADVLTASIQCRGVGGQSLTASRRPRVEFQADAWAGFFLMPRATTVALAQELGASAGDMSVFVRELARISEASPQAARIRIAHLGGAVYGTLKRQPDLFSAA